MCGRNAAFNGGSDVQTRRGPVFQSELSGLQVVESASECNDEEIKR
jgi:hypothetical protein